MRRKDKHIGRRIGNYRIIAFIAKGSSARIYLAEHALFRRRVAIKLPRANRRRFWHSRRSRQEYGKFLREAAFLAGLKHPHILQLYDAGLDKGQPYLIIEYAARGSLRDLLRQYTHHPLPLEQAIPILSQVGQALHFAHQLGIIHSDVKPENILFNEDDQALLADFGIALLQKQAGIGHAAEACGTLAYMSPERFRGEYSSQSDQYALGCVAYELVTDRRPFVDQDADTLVYKHMHEQPVAPTQINPQLPRHIEHAILKALAKDPDDRHKDVLAFVQALATPVRMDTHTVFVMSRTSSVRRSGKSKEDWLNEGEALHKLERHAEALVAYEEALRLDPYYADAYSNQGNVFYHLQRYEKALEAYKTAMRLDPACASYHYGKGIALYCLGYANEALAAFERTIQLDPVDSLGHYGKGLVLADFRHYKAALVAYQQALRLDPHFALAYYGKGKALVSLKCYVAALAAYEQAIQLDPDNADFHAGKGKVLRLLEKAKAAQPITQPGVCEEELQR